LAHIDVAGGGPVGRAVLDHIVEDAEGGGAGGGEGGGLKAKKERKITVS